MHVIDHWANPPATLSFTDPATLHLWLIDLTSPMDGRQQLLTADEMQRAARMQRDTDRHHFIQARGAMRAILARYLDCSGDRLLFDYGPLGKPALASPASELQFNLTHADGLALLAISHSAPVGIDLEPDKRRKNARAIARRVFDQALLQQLEQLPESIFQHRFISHWCRMEACAKALGKGVFSPAEQALSYFDFEPLAGWVAAVASPQPLPAAGRWHCFRFSSS